MAALKTLVDAVGLFPSGEFDAMLESYCTGSLDADHAMITFDDGSLAGIAYYAPERMTAGTWNLYLVGVAPQRRSEGIGSALLRAVDSTLAARGERVLLVETSGLPEFERTRAFYRANGYDEEARIREFYAAGEDKVVFRKALRQPETSSARTS